MDLLNILLIFQEMENYLISSMKRNLKRHLNWEADEGFDWTQWQAIQIGSLRSYRAETEKIINFAFDKASPETEKFITDAFHGGAKSFDLSIDKATQTATSQIPIDQLADARLDIDKDGKVVWTTEAEAPKRPSLVVATLPDPVLDQTPDESFFQVNKAKLDACINDTHKDFDKVRFAAAKRMGAGYEEILKKADIFMQTGTMTLQQAVDMASREFLAAGLNCVEYENGRRVNITSYVEMALRASSRRAALTAEGAKRDQWNEHLVVSPTLHSTCEHCQKWQGIVLVDDVYSDGKPDGVHPLLSEAIKDQFLHPNCRHPLVTYFEGITEIPTASPFEQTRTQYEAEQRQRTIELMIRKYKRLRDGSVDPANIDKYSLKVKQWNAIMKQHLKNNPELRRKPERETVYNVKSAGAINNVSGGLSGAIKDANRQDEHANRYYEEIRKRTDDVDKIAKNTGLKRDVVSSIKDYTFIAKHNLGGELKQFDSNYYMSTAWQRLSDLPEQIKPSDLLLLKHERLESYLVSRYNYSQDVAHTIVSKKYNYGKALQEDGING